VAVLDGQAAEVRVFGPNGAYLRTMGQKGEGPGELSYPEALVALAGDTLAVYDRGNGRITRFNPDGEVGRVATLQFDGYERPYFTSFFDDGSMVGYLRLERRDQRLNTSDEQTFVLDSAALTLSGTDGALEDTIGVFPGFEVVSSVSRRDNNVIVQLVPAAFARALVFAAVICAHAGGIRLLGRAGWQPRLGEALVRGLNLFAWGTTQIGTKRKPLPPAVRACYLAPYDNWKNRIAVARFVQDIPLEPGDRAWPVVAEATAPTSTMIPVNIVTPPVAVHAPRDLRPRR